MSLLHVVYDDLNVIFFYLLRIKVIFTSNALTL